MKLKTGDRKKLVTHEAPKHESLWVVWIDTNVGWGKEPDWETNSPPQTLGAALDESFGLRQKGWPCLVLQDGKSPDQTT